METLIDYSGHQFIDNSGINVIFKYWTKKGRYIEGRGLTDRDAVIDALNIACEEKEPYKI